MEPKSEGILRSIATGLSNGVLEAINGNVQAAKRKAKGKIYRPVGTCASRVRICARSAALDRLVGAPLFPAVELDIVWPGGTFPGFEKRL